MTPSQIVVIGADTHLDTIHLAALSETGKPLGDAEFPTRPSGYYVAVKWAQSFGTVTLAGVEGTNSYGAGLTRALQDGGIDVVEVNRPDRAARRRRGKSDPLDAYAAARTALSGHGLAAPKDERTLALSALLTARRGAVKAHTAATNQIQSLLVTAPSELRECYRRYTTRGLVKELARCRPTAHTDPTAVAVLTALKALAYRAQFLHHQEHELTEQIHTLTQQMNPGLRAAHGVGPDTAAALLITAGMNPHRLRSEAAFAALCGAAPVPASSGKTTRHRLSRGGDRTANNALYRIALVRMSNDPRTPDYVARQTANGRSKIEIIRLLKRAVAREVFRLLSQPCAIDDYSDLRPARQAKNITLTTVANHLDVWPNDISRLERGLKRDDTLAANYREYLSAA
ncbi:IS110 family RNA-guided transposase [Mycolicibacterium smegmatis]|uniref:Transposase n=3 Tax=Mycolicibacterium smegmatis TaxID=1772 RepID=A0R509_MYCS2|nr:IS110 family transposase [Mycolicibacterium smegmatis]ABK70144.1 transposase [Mycolicibacterium smegmatis MC2 155]AFP42296.1 Transposase IS116/IS110/IS902 family protein [Mycolicibacterium smegmatis MC2 155]AIU11021.1 transposase [Mycolicibacterium smegmatis MC2 155]AIU17645.1 transposase [Mycolicibacterium smegmatis]AIU24269.1 transposase [Mycolicibacterium smegmatis]